jgi:hypothetical protein
MYQRWYHWQDKPFQLNTKARWAGYGYAVRKNAPIVSELKTDRRKQKYPLYHSDDLLPMRGKEAMHRRYMTCLTHFRSQVDKIIALAFELADMHQVALSEYVLSDFVGQIVDNGIAKLDLPNWEGHDVINHSNYFNKPYWCEPDNIHQWLDREHQTRLKNTTLEFVYAAIESGHYHRQAAAKRATDEQAKQQDAFKNELIRRCIACVPVCPLPDYTIDYLLEDKWVHPTNQPRGLMPLDLMQIAELVYPTPESERVYLPDYMF